MSYCGLPLFLGGVQIIRSVQIGCAPQFVSLITFGTFERDEIRTIKTSRTDHLGTLLVSTII